MAFVAGFGVCDLQRRCRSNEACERGKYEVSGKRGKSHQNDEVSGCVAKKTIASQCSVLTVASGTPCGSCPPSFRLTATSSRSVARITLI